MVNAVVRWVILFAVACGCCNNGYAQSPPTIHPTVEGSSFLRVSATVGSGLTVEHTVKELFLTDTAPRRANYMIELLSTARSAHSIGVDGRILVVKCGADTTLSGYQLSGKAMICTINPYLDTTIYYITIFEI